MRSITSEVSFRFFAGGSFVVELDPTGCWGTVCVVGLVDWLVMPTGEDRARGTFVNAANFPDRADSKRLYTGPNMRQSSRSSVLRAFKKAWPCA